MDIPIKHGLAFAGIGALTTALTFMIAGCSQPQPQDTQGAAAQQEAAGEHAHEGADHSHEGADHAESEEHSHAEGEEHAHAEGEEHAHAEGEEHAHAEGEEHAHAEGEEHSHDGDHTHADENSETETPDTVDGILHAIADKHGIIEAAETDDAISDAHHVPFDIHGLFEKLQPKLELNEADAKDFANRLERLQEQADLIETHVHDGEMQLVRAVITKLNANIEAMEQLAGADHDH